MMQSKIKYLSSVCVPLGEEEPKCSNRGDRIPSESQHRATTTKVLRRPQNNTNGKPHSRTANHRTATATHSRSKSKGKDINPRSTARNASRHRPIPAPRDRSRVRTTSRSVVKKNPASGARGKNKN